MQAGVHFLFCSPQPSPVVPLCRWGWFCSPGLDAFQSLENPLQRQVETQLSPVEHAIFDTCDPGCPRPPSQRFVGLHKGAPETTVQAPCWSGKGDWAAGPWESGMPVESGMVRGGGTAQEGWPMSSRGGGWAGLEPE